MRKRLFLWAGILLVVLPAAQICRGQNANDLKLKDYHPISIYKTVQTRVEKARYPVIDFHSHDYLPTVRDVDWWVKVMDSVGIEKTMILSYSTGVR